jgi:hypothetical protein
MFKKGRAKTGGRKPGTANKRTREIAEKAAAEGISPLEVQLRRELWRQAHANGEMDLELAGKACVIARECAVYIHPKLASIEARVETVLSMSDELLALRLESGLDRLDRLPLIEAVVEDDEVSAEEEPAGVGAQP